MATPPDAARPGRAVPRDRAKPTRPQPIGPPAVADTFYCIVALVIAGALLV
jgi:hypothetical protein